MTATEQNAPLYAMDKPGLQRLVDALKAMGYATVGPVVRDFAVTYERISSVSELPEGWSDEQEGGKYRLKQNGSRRVFGITKAGQSWKRWLFPPERTLIRACRTGRGMEVESVRRPSEKRAFIGVRPCDLAAIRIQDRVFMGDKFTDPQYASRRCNVFLVAVNCSAAGGTCFCSSMGTGPGAAEGYDIALTEIGEGGKFVAGAGSAEGGAVLGGLGLPAAGEGEKDEALRAVEGARKGMGRTLETGGIRDLLYSSYESPRWAETGDRCLGCANCTLVCPTCFCMTMEDRTTLDGKGAARVSIWDSCFTLDYTFTAGGVIRKSGASRYRQWLIHKLAAWQDQFGTSGCTGCGRCITWCPVGIDITEEARALREGERAPQEA